MKKLFLIFLIINFFLFGIFSFEEEKEDHIKLVVKNYIEKLGYENRKSITRDEFRKLFLYIFENKENDGQDSKEDLDIMFSLTNTLFDFIVKENEQIIEMEKIYDYFETNNIVTALKDLLKQLGMEKLIDNISESFMDTLKNKEAINDPLDTNKNKNSDL